MTNRKIFINEMLTCEQLDNISGGIQKITVRPQKTTGPRRFANPRRNLGEAIGRLISNTIIYILEKNKS